MSETPKTAPNKHLSKDLSEDVIPAVQRLLEAGFLRPKRRVLGYGCGRGAYVAWLKRYKMDVCGYDPYPPFGYSQMPEGFFDDVILAYLMTRLKTDDRRRETLDKAGRHLRPGGQLLILSRDWRHAGGRDRQPDRESAQAYLRALLDPAHYDRVVFPDPAPGSPEIALVARRSGLHLAQRPYDWVADTAELGALCKRLEKAPLVALDIETTLVEPREVCTIQLATPDHTWIIDARGLPLDPVQRVLENDQVTKVIHNAIFEEQVLARYGIKIRNIYDTLTASRKKHRRGDTGGGHKLGEVCERELGIYIDKSPQTSDWTQRPLTSEQLAYAAIDAEVLIDLYNAFNPPPPPQTLDLFTDL